MSGRWVNAVSISDVVRVSAYLLLLALVFAVWVRVLRRTWRDRRRDRRPGYLIPPFDGEYAPPPEVQRELRRLP